MKLLDKLISKLEVDKILHSYVSLILTMLLYALTGNVIVATVGTLALGLAKEFYDNKTYGVFSYKDLTADLSGIAIAVVIILLM